MKEEFLHYIWLHKKINVTQLYTTKGEKLEILHFGHYLQTAGPDFFNAQLIIDYQKWAGNIEIHLKSSDWYVHHHEKDANYDNVILHVVWEHDVDVYRKDNTEVPVLELKQYVASKDIINYTQLTNPKSWINCENQIGLIEPFVIENWLERLFLERLELKSELVFSLLKASKNDWELVLFCLLAKSFGLNSNGNSFFKMAQSIPFQVLRKEMNHQENLEALFFGLNSLLEFDGEDTYFQLLKAKWNLLKEKYQLQSNHLEKVYFYKLRPDNFPTIRLSQLAVLYHTIPNLFEKCIRSSNLIDLYQLFDINASIYWNYHYNFDRESSFKKKRISKSFIDLLIINTIIPIQFAYSKYLGKDSSEAILELIRQLKPEKNNMIFKFAYFGVASKSALESQSLLQLKKQYCDAQRCLDCHIGIHLIRK